VFLVARRQDELDKTKEMIEKDGGVAHILVADLSSVDSINGLIVSVKALTDRIDVLCNIAGVWHGEREVYAGKSFQEFNQSIILDTMTVGVIAPLVLSHGLLPLMAEHSKIINLSGTFEDGAKGWLPYYVSKRSIEDLTIGLSQELADKNVQVNCISPSDTATESYERFFPQYMGQAVDPKEIAQAFIDLSDPKRSETGKVIVVKKGMERKELFHA
jgi:NAD(P)-dependent dehydrogenase (short-subunit alcohol dehydrogenase family)